MLDHVIRFDRSIKVPPIRATLTNRKKQDSELERNMPNLKSGTKGNGKDERLIGIVRIEESEVRSEDKANSSKDNRLKEKRGKLPQYEPGVLDGAEYRERPVVKTVCLMKKPLAFHDDGARAEWMDHRKLEEDLIRDRLNDMDRDWHDMIADPEMDRSIVQVSLFSTKEVDEAQEYRVEFPEEMETVSIPGVPNLSANSEIHLSNAFNRLVLKRKDYEGRDREGLEDEGYCINWLEKGKESIGWIVENDNIDYNEENEMNRKKRMILVIGGRIVSTRVVMM